jgi:hypothetical protein
MSGCYEIIIENLDLLTKKSFRDVNKDNDTTLELLISEKTCRFSDRKVPENIKEMLPKPMLKKLKKRRLTK